MGRTKILKYYHKTKKSWTIDKDLANKIDEDCKKENLSESEYINRLLKTVLSTEQNFARYKLVEAVHQKNYWEGKCKLARELKNNDFLEVCKRW